MEAPLDEALGRAAARALSLAGDPEARQQVVDRFRDKYLVAILRASGPAALGRAWGSFRYYLVTPPTRLKPFHLTEPEADAVLAALREIVEGPVG